MEQAATSGTRVGFAEGSITREANVSAVSWAAVIAGAFVTAAMALVLLALGAGFGLSAVSPWANAGVSATTLGAGAIVWMIVIQIIASAMGGYLAGRLRIRWATIHTDEVFFRDTAHGFLVWAVGLVITAAFLTTAAATMAGNQPSTTTSGSATARSVDPTAYYVDQLFHSGRVAQIPDSVHADAGRILANGLRRGDLPAADRTYLVQLVSAATGSNQTDAEARVSQVYTDAKQALDTARKEAARFLLWLFLALLIGAFCASYAATMGGRQRDGVKVV
jgi:hypothetical protein